MIVVKGEFDLVWLDADNAMRFEDGYPTVQRALHEAQIQLEFGAKYVTIYRADYDEKAAAA